MVEIIDLKTRIKTVIPTLKQEPTFIIRVADPGERAGLSDFEVSGSIVIDPYWLRVTPVGHPTKVIFACPNQRVVWCQDATGWEKLESSNDN